MARRIKSKMRKHLGNRTWGGGNTKNRRGKGNRGGVGRAGFHKHRWLHTIKYEGTSQRARDDKGFRNPTRKAVRTVSLDEIAARIRAGDFEKNAEGFYAVELKGAKVLSNGSLGEKAAVRAAGFSKKAKEKIEAMGGSAATI